MLRNGVLLIKSPSQRFLSPQASTLPSLSSSNMSWPSEPGPLWEQGRTKPSLSLHRKTIPGSVKWLTPGPLPFCFRGPQPGGRQEDGLAHHPFCARAVIPKERRFRFILVLQKTQHTSRVPSSPGLTSSSGAGHPVPSPVARKHGFCIPPCLQRKAGEQKPSYGVD